MNYIVIMLLFAGLSWWVGNTLKRKFAEYSQIPLASGMSGREIAEKMLYDHGIHDVKVTSVDGQLTDHYNPLNKTVNLSAEVYQGRNAAAAAVAAHECGHAVQHAVAYYWLGLRSALVPVVSVSSRFVMWILLLGVLMINAFPSLLLVGIGIFSLTTLFSIITLPVEYDASNRALAWIDRKGIVTAREHEMSKDALKWAARTYVVAALASIATLLYYISIFMGRRRD
ncbi:MAG: hypothetical protein A3G23_14895 [Bacteroidetes bacterium RIFCSPLOWO2_12_FULL_37_12]|nr:MAG: hypothetical protein A3G23_14895 [Bacteroidetes bacterium RIFCSPLOWO2_12_FULL_37_12]